MTINSALYVGDVCHHRFGGRQHTLRHRVYWLLVDLVELPDLGRSFRLFSHNRANLVSLHDRDHGDGSNQPLIDQARSQLVAAGVDASQVTVRLLCMPRVAAYDFNPLSVYFCTSPDGKPVAMIYEVRNTFGGRHAYVIPAGAQSTKGEMKQQCDKAFYVSPFMDNDLQYDFKTRAPDERVSLSVAVRRGDQPIIHTALAGRRRTLTDANLARLNITHPLLPLKVTAAIHWHALRMWLAGFAVNPSTPSRAVTRSIIRHQS